MTDVARIDCHQYCSHAVRCRNRSSLPAGKLEPREAPEKAAHRELAEECGLYAPHVSDYLNDEPTYANGKKRLDLPACVIPAFELVVGNRAISQYLMRLGALTIMEEVIQGRHP